MAAAFMLHSGPDRTGIDPALAVQHLPAGEWKLLETSVGPQVFSLYPLEEWKRQIVNNRIQNAICNYCFKKEETPLRYCTRCHCTWFCSAYCEDHDASHKSWCCNPNAPADTGPMRILVADARPDAHPDSVPWKPEAVTVISPGGPSRLAVATFPTGTLGPPSAAHQRQAQEMMRDVSTRQDKSDEAALLERKLAGNAAYERKDLEDALRFYTAAVRLPLRTLPISDTRIACWMNRSKVFAAMHLWHLALGDVRTLEAMMQGTQLSFKHLKTKLNYLLQLKLYDTAISVISHALQNPTLARDPRALAEWRKNMESTKRAKADQDKARQQEKTAQLGNMRGMVADADQHKLQERFRQGNQATYLPCMRKLSIWGVGSVPQTSEETKRADEEYTSKVQAQMAPRTTLGASPLGGTGVFATQAILRGQVVMLEPTEMSGSVATDRCNFCVRPLQPARRVPCSKECGEVYCSFECRDYAANSYHTWQCDTEIQTGMEQVRKDCHDNGLTMSSRLPMVMMRLLGMIPRNANILDELPILSRLTVGAVGQANWVHGVSVDQGFGQYARIVNALQLQPAWFDYYTFDYLRFLISNNGFALSSEAERAARKPGLGMAMFRSASYFNHSCAPNCGYHFRIDEAGSTIFMVAERDIAVGEEVMISYIEHTEPLAERKMQLMQYGFTCRCSKCSEEGRGNAPPLAPPL
jgi:hypothetical protein